MKIRYLALLGTLIILLLSQGIVESQQGEWGDEGWTKYDPPEVDTTPIILTMLMLIVFAVIILIMIYSKSAKDSEAKQKQYRLSLNALEKQLADGKISEETYKELRRELADEYKQKWYE